jgi:hypothetical protein
LVEQLGVRYFISRKGSAREQLEPEILSKFLDTCTLPEYEWSIFQVSRYVPEKCVPSP